MPVPDSVPRRPALATAVIAGTVALIESSGPLDDRAELRLAHRAQPTRAAQFMERAWLLGERLGLPAELARWRHVGLIVILMLAALVALSALGTARAVVGDARSINAMAAFITLLGLHLLTLALWLLGLLWPGAAASLSLGRLALWLTARLPLERGPHSFSVLRAVNRLLKRHKLLPWAFGVVSHTIWALAFGLILAVLAFGFAFHAYRLSWETTILSADFFQRFVHLTGSFPSMLGFAVPDAAAIQRAGASNLQTLGEAAAQSEWAWWLMGCVFTYGLLPRVFLALLSYARWRAGVARMGKPDSADPYVRAVFARLDALDPPVVTDPEQRPIQVAQPHRTPGDAAVPGTLAVIGFELPPEVPWPLPPISGLPDGAEGELVLVERIAGSAAERQEVILALEQARPWSLWVVCHAASSPDRGTARFLREVAPVARQCHLLLVAEEGGAAPAETESTRRWADWLAAERLDAIKLAPESSELDQSHA
ncbi:DUF2868 domain-containing protein [Ottowia sp. VDI28]|uniref:DUF2868 domain-containing protein n=1 Tax=Ottowia sp. VDI28 TaxID=3133968 RepID=UPI003C2B8B1A